MLSAPVLRCPDLAESPTLRLLMCHCLQGHVALLPALAWSTHC